MASLATRHRRRLPVSVVVVAGLALGGLVLAAPAALAAEPPAAATTTTLDVLLTDVPQDIELPVTIRTLPDTSGAVTGQVAVELDGDLLEDTRTTAAPLPGGGVGAELTLVDLPVGPHSLVGVFEGSDGTGSSRSGATAVRVAPASIEATFTDEEGDPLTSPLSSPVVVASGSGQYPGAPVELQSDEDGTWSSIADGTVSASGAFSLEGVVVGDLSLAGSPVGLRVVSTPFAGAETLVSDVEDVVVPPFELTLDLDVDPGPYRPGDGATNLVRASVSWYGEELAVAGADDLQDAVDDGSLVVWVDGVDLDPRTVRVEDVGSDSAVLTFPVSDAPGPHEVQLTMVLSDGVDAIHAESPVGTYTTLATSLDLNVITDGGGFPVETVRPGEFVGVQVFSLVPGTVVHFAMHSDPLDLGTETANADGYAGTRFQVPADTPAGRHEVVAHAVDPYGNRLSASYAFVVLAASDDPEGQLPVTGSSAGPLGALAASFLVVGAGAVAFARRRA
ncbi:LPXTG cell wall anchor domain-containing protein [Cellulomonas massiliensis]|uniref:LPXTG cell wall anchor domain-containing protein n=1 Tax=Cellulomonas massiliensis TaxID=1465811 RepID=UPI0002FF7A28|nr:LPXTG cell wall anchor domain-containing protein [Cellulomonas massiliensis]